MRKCIICLEDKELDKFRKRQIWFSHTCKACYAAQYRTGKVNTGRFKKGHIPWIKGKKGVEPRTTPRYTKKSSRIFSEHPMALKRSQWALDVKRRDGFTCKGCGRQDKLNAHHVESWKDNKERRFDISNGITLCARCHMWVERKMEISLGMRPKDGFGKIKKE